jgi:glyoxylase-like metal-dependent hydrolase (beta-lactamase superfamily II)
MHRVIVLIEGFVEDTALGRQRAGGTVTLVRGRPNLLVDTGDPVQQDQLLAALTGEGLSPADIAYVINTHGHLDHVGNNGLFPHATFVLDCDVAHEGAYWQHDFAAGALDLPAEDDGPPVRLIRATGHTDHDLVVLVATAQGRIAIAGDLFEHAGDEADHAWERWSRDPVAQRISRNRVALMAEYIVPGHGAMFASSTVRSSR